MFFFLYSRYPFLIADTKYNYMLCVYVYGLSSQPSTGIILFGGTNLLYFFKGNSRILRDSLRSHYLIRASFAHFFRSLEMSFFYQFLQFDLFFVPVYFCENFTNAHQSVVPTTEKRAFKWILAITLLLISFQRMKASAYYDVNMHSIRRITELRCRVVYK